MSSQTYIADMFVLSTVESEILLENDDGSHNVKNVHFDEIMIEMYGNFKPVPLIHVIPIQAVIIFLSVFFNTLVAMYYRKAKTSNRPYVLALVVLDFVCVLFVVPVKLVTSLVDGSHVMEMIRLDITFWVYLLYVTPSFFLAVDRFMAVFFPHKFKLWSKKIRNFKIVFFVIYCALVLAFTVSYLLGPGLMIIFGLMVAFIMLIVIVLGSFAMYIAIYVKLVRARKSMKEMQSGARVSKSKSHMKAIKIGSMLFIV